MSLRLYCAFAALFSTFPIWAQSSLPSTASATVIPNVIRYSGALPDRADQTQTLTFSLYEKSKEGQSLWSETHEIKLSHTGAYSVLLGSKNALPTADFASGQARWIAVTPRGETETARVPVTSTAYAIKAGDAETLGGLPASAFVRSTEGGPGAVSNASGTITGVRAGTGLSGGGNSGTVTLSLNTGYTNSLYARLGAANTFALPQTITTSALTGFAVNDSYSGATAIYANSTGANSKGLYANANGTAITGFTHATSRTIQNAGVLGKVGAESVLGGSFGVGDGVGIWGDGGRSVGRLGVFGTVDDGVAGRFAANSPDFIAVLITNQAPGSTSFYAGGSGVGDCRIDNNGNLSCSGTIQGVAQVSGDRHLATYSIQAAEDWSEDAGSAMLHHGSTHVNLDAVFAETVNTGVEYHVFLTPDGDSKGLYIAGKTPTGFDVKEMGGGKSSISFEYRIMAKRRGHEATRLADVTDRVRKDRQQSARFSATKTSSTND